MQRKTNQAVFAILAMLTFWLVVHTVKINKVLPDFKILNRTVNVLMDRIIEIEDLMEAFKSFKGKLEYEETYKEQVEYLETFAERFNRMRVEYGPGYIFDWNERLFTTYFAEELTLTRIAEKENR